MECTYQTMESKVSIEMNEEFDKEFTIREIKGALDQMNPNKAPGPDGMTAMFYQKHWDIIGEDIYKVLIDCLNRGLDLSRINHTNIVLIPKSQSPCMAKDFRPMQRCLQNYVESPGE